MENPVSAISNTPLDKKEICRLHLLISVLRLGLQLVPAIGLASCIFLFPESPRWLVDHDRHDEALRNLAKLHAKGDINDPYVQAEFEIIKAQIEDEHQHAAKSYRRALRQ